MYLRGQERRDAVKKHGVKIWKAFVKTYKKENGDFRTGFLGMDIGIDQITADIDLEKKKIEITCSNVQSHRNPLETHSGQYSTFTEYIWNHHIFKKIGNKWELEQDWSDLEELSEFKRGIDMFEYTKKDRLEYVVNRFMTDFNSEQRAQMILKVIEKREKLKKKKTKGVKKCIK